MGGAEPEFWLPESNHSATIIRAHQAKTALPEIQLEPLVLAVFLNPGSSPHPQSRHCLRAAQRKDVVLGFVVSIVRLGHPPQVSRFAR